eukprot:1154607-Pleurochrysis_carterae.AAC.1
MGKGRGATSRLERLGNGARNGVIFDARFGVVSASQPTMLHMRRHLDESAIEQLNACMTRVRPLSDWRSQVWNVTLFPSLRPSGREQARQLSPSPKCTTLGLVPQHLFGSTTRSAESFVATRHFVRRPLC